MPFVIQSRTPRSPVMLALEALEAKKAAPKVTKPVGKVATPKRAPSVQKVKNAKPARAPAGKKSRKAKP